MTVRHAALLVAISATSLGAQSRNAADAAIKSQVAAYEAALNARDAAAVAGVFTADGSMIYLDAPRVAGRAALTEMLRPGLAALPPDYRIRLAVTAIDWSAPTVAVVDLHATYTGVPIPPTRGTAVFVNQKGQWLMHSQRVFADARMPGDAPAAKPASSGNVAPQGDASSPLDGVWEYQPPLRGYAMYHDKRYVFLFTRPDSGAAPTDTAQATHARLYRSLGAQAGTYTIADTIVTMQRAYNKNPSSAPLTWRWSYEVKGDTLVWKALNAEGKVTSRGVSLRARAP